MVKILDRVVQWLCRAANFKLLVLLFGFALLFEFVISNRLWPIGKTIGIEGVVYYNSTYYYEGDIARKRDGLEDDYWRTMQRYVDYQRIMAKIYDYLADVYAGPFRDDPARLWVAYVNYKTVAWLNNVAIAVFCGLFTTRAMGVLPISRRWGLLAWPLPLLFLFVSTAESYWLLQLLHAYPTRSLSIVYLLTNFSMMDAYLFNLVWGVCLVDLFGLAFGVVAQMFRIAVMGPAPETF